jgi:hypothetical protein
MMEAEPTNCQHQGGRRQCRRSMAGKVAKMGGAAVVDYNFCELGSNSKDNTHQNSMVQVDIIIYPSGTKTSGPHVLRVGSYIFLHKNIFSRCCIPCRNSKMRSWWSL